MIFKWQIKVRGLLYLRLFRKLRSFLPNRDEPKPKYIDNRKMPIIATKLFILSGFFHFMIWILAVSYDLFALSIGAFITTLLTFWLASMFSKLIKSNLMNETDILTAIIIIVVYNTIDYLELMLMGVTERLLLLNVFISIIFCLNIINFLLFFNTASKLNRMVTVEKLNYFSKILIRIIGWWLIFSILSYLRQRQFLALIFCLIFGIYNLKYGHKLVNKPDDLKIYYIALKITSLTFISAILLSFIYILDFTFLLIIVSFSLVIPIQFYYTKICKKKKVTTNLFNGLKC